MCDSQYITCSFIVSSPLPRAPVPVYVFLNSWSPSVTVTQATDQTFGRWAVRQKEGEKQIPNQDMVFPRQCNPGTPVQWHNGMAMNTALCELHGILETNSVLAVNPAAPQWHYSPQWWWRWCVCVFMCLCVLVCVRVSGRRNAFHRAFKTCQPDDHTSCSYSFNTRLGWVEPGINTVLTSLGLEERSWATKYPYSINPYSIQPLHRPTACSLPRCKSGDIKHSARCTDPMDALV